MPVPDERVLMTSMRNMTISSNPCYRTYNQNIKLFLKQYILISKLFPKDITYKVMKFSDPRDIPVHKFHNSIGHVCFRTQTIFYKNCSVCGLNICI